MIKHVLLICLIINSGQLNGFSNSIYLHQGDSRNSVAKNDSKLFLHIDKTIYTNNEQIWFTGYLLDNEGKSTEDHKYLTVYLTREDNSQIQLEHKFIIENGISFGNILLPDTIAPGNYKLLAYTNVIDTNDKPVSMFKQEITIKSIVQNDIQANITFFDNSIGLTKEYRFNIQLPSEVNKKSEAPIVSFLDCNGTMQRLKADSLGKYHVSIPTQDLDKYKSDVLICVKKGTSIRYFNEKLPVKKKKAINVNFYPEGGPIVNGVVNSIAWETRSANGNPINTTAILYRNDEILDTIRSLSYGIGKFKFLPTLNCQYSIKLIDSANKLSNSYPLPNAYNLGITLNLKKAVVGDTLGINLIGNRNQNIVLLIHDNKTIFSKTKLTLTPGSLSFNVDLKGIQKGIATITIIDSLQRPIIERLFFAHYDEKVISSIFTDKDSYKKRDTTQVSMKLTDQKKGKPVSGLVSIAVVQNNRIESNKQLNINSFQFLMTELNKLSSLEANLAISDPAYLENILLVKGWRKYNYPEVQKSGEHIVKMNKTTKFTGNLLYFGKLLKQEKSITLITDSSFKLIVTDKFGDFELQPQDISVSQTKKAWLIVNEKNKTGYSISVQVPSTNINTYFMSEDIKNIENNEFVNETTQNKPLLLKEVSIKGINSNLLYKAPRPNVKTNLCGDYICSKGHLNCQDWTHLVGSRPARMGDMIIPTFNKTFTTTDGPSGRSFATQTTTIDRVPYTGCLLDGKTINELTKINGIKVAKEFYRDTDSSNSQDDFESTVYWNYGLISDNEGKINFSFRNSNITGEFRIIVQGISDNLPIFAEQKVNIK